MSARHDVNRGTEWIEYRIVKKLIELYKTMIYKFIPNAAYVTEETQSTEKHLLLVKYSARNVRDLHRCKIAGAVINVQENGRRICPHPRPFSQTYKQALFIVR